MSINACFLDTNKCIDACENTKGCNYWTVSKNGELIRGGAETRKESNRAMWDPVGYDMTSIMSYPSPRNFEEVNGAYDSSVGSYYMYKEISLTHNCSAIWCRSASACCHSLNSSSWI